MKKIVYILSFALALTVSSCSGWLDVNKNPNRPSEVDNGLQIPAIELNVLNATGFYGNLFGSFFSQHYANKPGGPQYLSLSHWDVSDNSNFSSSASDYLYRICAMSVSNNAKLVKERAESENLWGDYLAATVLRVYAYQMLVDAFGELPYTEALNTAIRNPKYDEGNVIYAGLIAELDDALAKVSPSDVVSKNMTFDGSTDAGNWIRFANALKLRLLMREHKVVDVKSQLDALVAENNFPTSDIGYVGCWSNQAGLDNPFYNEAVRKRGDTGTGRTMEVCANMAVTSALNEVSDPRRAYKFVPSVGHGNTWDGGFYDSQYSTEQTAKMVDADTYAELNLAYNNPVYLITVAETDFFLAEYYSTVAPDAAKAKAAYEAAIDASFALHGCTAAQAQALYATGGKYAWDAAKAEELIGIQKWIHLAFVNGFESWCEIRRTGYPVFNSKTGKDIYAKWSEIAKKNVADGLENPTPQTSVLINEGVYTAGTLYTPANVSVDIPDNTVVGRLLYPRASTQSNENAPDRKPATAKVFWAK